MPVLLPTLLFTVVAGCDESLKPATLALQARDPGRALVLLEPLRASCSQSSHFFEVLGLADELSGNKERAETALRRAVSLDARSPKLVTELGATLLRNGKPDEAAAVLDQALKLDPGDLVILKYRVGAAVESRDWRRADELFRQMNGPNDAALLQAEPILFLWFVQTLLETNQGDRINSVLAEQRRPMPPDLLFSLGTLFARHALYDKAVTYFKQVPPDAADDALYFNLALSYSHLQQFDEARECYFVAVDKHPDHVDAYLHVGLDYVSSGQSRMGIPWLYKAHELAPERSDITYVLVEQLITLDYFASSKELLEKSPANIPNNPMFLVAQGDLARAQGNAGVAAATYRKALAIKPGLIAALIGLARADVSRGKELEAKTVLDTAFASDPQDPFVNAEIGLLEAHRGQLDASFEHLRRAWSQNRSNPQVALELARAYQRKGQQKDALGVLESVAPEMQDSSGFHLLLAQIYTLLHRPSEANAERAMLARLQTGSEDALHFDNPATYIH